MRIDLLSPFPIEPASCLPVTGDLHPLRREYQRWMSWANLFTVSLALGTLAVVSLLRHPPAAPEPHQVHIVVDNIVPVSIQHTLRPTAIQTQPAIPVQFGIPELVPKVDPGALPFPTMEEITRLFDTRNPGVFGEGEVVVDPTKAELPAPDAFVAYEEPPHVLRFDPPLYPPLAREAGIEGTVVFRVLVGTNGRVLQCILLSGNPILADAALASARSAVFTPAEQQHRPVAVWVQLPIAFSLN